MLGVARARPEMSKVIPTAYGCACARKAGQDDSNLGARLCKLRTSGTRHQHNLC